MACGLDVLVRRLRHLPRLMAANKDDGWSSWAHMTLAWNVPKLHLSCTASLIRARKVGSSALAGAYWGTLYHNNVVVVLRITCHDRSSIPSQTSLARDLGNSKSPALIAGFTRSYSHQADVIFRASAHAALNALMSSICRAKSGTAMWSAIETSNGRSTSLCALL